jgi:hypothetical protein
MWLVNRFATSLGFPPVEVDRSSFAAIDFGLPAIYYLKAQSWSAPCREIFFLWYRVKLANQYSLDTQRSGRANALVVRSKRTQDLE